jgi:prophage regulatory protein
MADRPTPELILAGEIAQRIPYSQNHLRRLEASGDFPRRIRIGANRVAWVRTEVNDWVDQRIAERTHK